MSTKNPQFQELSKDEQARTDGGSILGSDSNSSTVQTGGFVNVSQTDDDGDTSSTRLDFGSGSLLDSQND